MPPIANHGLSEPDVAARGSGSQFGGGADQVQAGRGAARLGRGRPARTDAEVIDGFGRRGVHLGELMGGPADQRARTDDVARDRQRQVVLAQVQHVGARRDRDIGAVVDRQQRVVAARRVGEHLQCFQLLPGLEWPEPLLTR